MSLPEIDKGRHTQLLKGVLDLCILALLDDGPLYGYAVVDALAGKGLDLVAEGTVYPLLTRMEKAGTVTSFKAPSPEGPPRKYYQLTSAGEHELAKATEQWDHLSSQVSAVLHGAGRARRTKEDSDATQ